MRRNGPGPFNPRYFPIRRTTARSHWSATRTMAARKVAKTKPAAAVTGPMAFNTNKAMSAPIKIVKTVTAMELTPVFVSMLRLMISLL